jgi:hypothetical protein
MFQTGNVDNKFTVVDNDNVNGHSKQTHMFTEVNLIAATQ